MKSQMIPFAGGVITEGPLLARDPGSCLFAINYEIPPQGGYRRIDGYTLYDGSETPAAIAGSGPIRGGFVYKDEVYAIRDNAGATAGVIWKATSSGWSQIATTLPAGGKYKIIIHNFFGASALEKVYGINGVGKAFEFDGTTVTFITTGMASDVPTNLVTFKNFLFLSFAGGSVQHSSAGDPHNWSPITGAAELAVGSEVTGFSEETGDILAIFSDKIHILTGTGAILSAGILDWNLKVHSSDSGALEHSMNRIGQTIFLNNKGLSSLVASDRFGDFSIASLSSGFRPLVLKLLRESTIVGSVTVKEKSQYRVFFDNGDVLCCSFDGEGFKGATTFEYPDPMVNVFSGDLNGTEVLLGGDAAGRVLLLDDGTSFNGLKIRSYLRPQYYHYKTPTERKRFRRIHLEADSEGESILYIEPDYNYSSTAIPKSIIYDHYLGISGGTWNIDEWNDFIWAVPLASNTPIRMQGVGFNMSPLFFHESNTESSFTIYGMIVDFDRRGRVR